MKKTNAILQLIVIFSSILGILLSLTICSPCPKGMRCVEMTHLAQAMLVVVTAFSGISIAIRKFRIHFSCIQLAALVVLTIDVFQKGCKVDDMRCNLVTFPTFRIISGILLLLVLLGIAIAAKERKTSGK